MAESTIHDRIEQTAKALPLALAALYVAGFIIVSFRLGGYGVSSLDLFRVQYVAAGFWFGIAVAIFFTLTAVGRPYAVKLIFSRKPPDLFERGFRSRIQTRELVGAIVSNCSMIVLAVGLFYLFRIIHHIAPKTSVPVSKLFLLLLSFSATDVLRQTWLLCKTKKDEGETWFEPSLCLVYFVLSVFLALQVFAEDFYSRLPFAFGGGDTRQVVFWLGKIESGPTTTLLERDGDSGYTIPYELLLENENSYVVISPKDNQRSIEFDRKAVGGVVVLGKRPKSAPAHFQRNISEPATSKYEVVERSQKPVPNFIAKGTHTEVDYVLSGTGHKYYASCDTATLDKLDPAATCALRILRSYVCVQPTDAEPKKALSDLKCTDDEGHPVYLYVSKKE